EGDAALVGDVLREIDREAEGVIEAKQLGARKDARTAFRELPDRVVEQAQSRGDRLAEALLLPPRHLPDGLASRDELRVDLAEQADHHRGDVVEERPFDAELA